MNDEFFSQLFRYCQIKKLSEKCCENKQLIARKKKCVIHVEKKSDECFFFSFWQIDNVLLFSRRGGHWHKLERILYS